MKIRNSFLFFCLLVVSGAFAQHYRTQSYLSNIKTVRSEILGRPLNDPIIELNGYERILISFDEMSYQTRSIYYSIVHCNADWTPSDLSEVEYIDGFSNGIVETYNQSVGTTVLYTNYRLEIPNDDMRLKFSGNYAVNFYEDGNSSQLLATACFSVVESSVRIDAGVRGNTDVELNGRYQQLEFTVHHDGYRIQDPFSDLKVIVRQNNRFDNQVINLKPTYTTLKKQSYVNNRSLIFEGGNEFRTIDFSSEYTYGRGIERIVFDRNYQHVILSADDFRKNQGYLPYKDANGKYIVNLQNSDNDSYEADYMWVHFSLPTDRPWFDGSVYLCGEFQGYDCNPKNRLEYSSESGSYQKTLLLKQGGYNYMYLFVPKGEQKGTLQTIEGSFWQTENSYQIFIYHRPKGERYDKLIGWKLL